MGNIAGADIVLGAGSVKNLNQFIQKNEARFAATPVFPKTAIPNGVAAHIGKGVFLRRCVSCDDYMLTYGSILYIHEFAKHEASHGGLVPGYNAPMLP